MCQAQITATYSTTANAGCASAPARALEVAHGARDRPQDHLREAEDREDRHDVEQQHVLDHVHEEQLVGEPVDRRDERDQRREQRADEAAQPPDRRLGGAPRRGPTSARAASASGRRRPTTRDADQHAGIKRPDDRGSCGILPYGLAGRLDEAMDSASTGVASMPTLDPTEGSL